MFIWYYAQVNPKAAESLADPEEYPNLFEDWQVALAVESKAAETRCVGKCIVTLSCNLYNLCTKHFRHVFD